MNKTFCVSCGFKNVYETTKPRFCASCGKSVDGTASASVSPASQEEDEYEGVFSFDLERLRRGIKTEFNNRPMKIDDVIGTSEANEQPMQRKAPNLPDGEGLIKRNILDCSKVSKSKDIDE